MKRKGKPIQKYFPIFHWRTCCKCRSQFKWEYGWRFYRKQPCAPLHYEKLCLCRKCARTKEDVLRISRGDL